MRIFRDLGLVEQLGSGMTRILEAYGKDVFHITDNFIKVTFPLDENGELLPGKTWESDRDNAKSDRDNVKSDRDTKRTQSENLILSILKKSPEITTKPLCEQSDFTESKVNRLLRRLRESGKIKRIGSDRKGYWQVIE